jgi:hypothetical protein
MGYGKTRLLEIVQLKLESDQEWHCTNLTLSRKLKYTIKPFTIELLQKFNVPDEEINSFNLDDTKECGRRLGISIVKYFNKIESSSQKLCILIDQAEVLSPPKENQFALIKDFFESLIPNMTRVITNRNRYLQWRFIFSGRYISEWKNKINRSIIFLKSNNLELFGPETILETISNYTKNKVNTQHEEIQKLAAATLYFSGGHPKCMVPIIKEGINSLIEDVIKNEDKYYKEELIPVIEDIKKHISPAFEIFETLCVMRKISRTLLEKFIEKELIKNYTSKFYVEEKLLSTFLIHRKENFLEDAIVRKVLAIHLRHSNVHRFRGICRLAIDCYMEELADPESLSPSVLAVEILFLELRACCLGKYSIEEIRANLMDKLNHILDIIVQNRIKYTCEVIEGVKDLIEKDKELELNIQYLLDSDIGPFLDIINSKIARLKP